MLTRPLLLGAALAGLLVACDDATSPELPGNLDGGPSNPLDATTAEDAEGSRDGSAASESDAGDHRPPVWSPLHSDATPSCTHEPAPVGFVPAVFGTFRVQSFAPNGLPRRVLMLGLEGELFALSCAEHTDAEDRQLSPDRRKALYSRTSDGTHYVTSWLLDGVFALPTESEGFALSSYHWLSDDFLAATGVRKDGEQVVENTRFVVRWDGSVVKRFLGEHRAEQRSSSVEIWRGDAEIAAYRFDADDEPGSEFYSLTFPDLAMKRVASGVGGALVSIGNRFDPVHRKLLVVGNGMGIDTLHVLDLQTEQLTDLGLVAASSASLSPDGQYVVVAGYGGLMSKALAGGGARSYQTLAAKSPIVFEPDGHRFGALTIDGSVVLVDPRTGEVSPSLLSAPSNPNEGPSAVGFTSDGLIVLGSSVLGGIWHSTAAGPAMAWAPERTSPRAHLSKTGSVLSYYYWDKPGAFVKFLGQAEQTVPDTGDDKGLAIGWSYDLKTAIIHVQSNKNRGKMLLWHPGEAAALDLLAIANAAADGAVIFDGLNLYSMLL